MKLYFCLLILISNSNINATTNLDSNLVLLLKNLDINLSNSISAYPGKLQFEQMKKTIESSACLKMYKDEVSKPQFKSTLDTLEAKFIQFDQLLKKYSEDKKFKEELSEFKKSVSELPKEKVCRFE